MRNFTLLIFLFLGGITTNAQNWKWVRGADTSGSLGSYGTVGVAASGNNPGGRHGAATWTDKAGNLWLFGGEGYSSSGTVSWLNDLWKYDKVTNQWTWMRGSNGPNSTGSYGTMGVPSNSNDPSAREFALAWTDTAGKFWLFGGDAYATLNNPARQTGDLWRYDPATNQWTWIKGFNTFDQNGVYNTMGTPNSTSLPGCRSGAAGWVDANNRFWMFGGRGWGASGSVGYLNDIWRYDPATSQWTWINGSNAILQLGSYGTKSVTASSNQPSGRGVTANWLAKTGDVYVFGGIGYALSSTSTTVQNRLGDLWKYDPAANNWTWMSGYNTGNQPGNYGTTGQPSSSVLPGSRGFIPASWVDAFGNLWMFGGNGYPGAGNIGQLNDMLKYDVTTGLWALIKGDTLANRPGIYGTMGTFASTNKPGGREYNTYWKNTGNDLWLFGGEGWDKDTTGVINHMNDLWLFSIPCNPDSISTSGTGILCHGKSATLSVVPPDNSAISWYTSPTSTSAIGNTSTFVTPTLSAGGSATTYTFYVGVATCSQSARTAVVLTINPAPQVMISSLSPLCNGASFSLSAGGAQSYTWHTGANTSVLTATAATGPYSASLTGSDQNGCIGATSSTFMVQANPVVSVTGPSSACDGAHVTFTASGADTYSWNNASTGAYCTALIGVGGVTFVTVLGTDTNGCQANSTATIGVNPSPTVTAKASSSVVCYHSPVTFTATGASSYSWSSGQTTSVMTHSATAYQTYSFTVTGTGTNGCTSTYTVSYKRSDCTGVADYQGNQPLSIYPNPSDGLFFVELPENFASGTFTVFDNLGQVLYSNAITAGETRVDLKIPPGIYYCSLNSNEGPSYQSKLIVR